MKFGICLPIRLDTDVHTNVRIARAAEDLGFDSVWASDHIVIPFRRSGMFTEHFYDPFILLTFIASETSKIQIGTSIIILPYRNPVVAAKMAATLDVLSGGRLIFGAGPGWMREEFEALGVPYDARGRMADEYIRIIRTLWEMDDPEFKGEFFSFSHIKFEPKPVQKPGPPVWIGGSSGRALERAALLGDGWQPTWVSPGDVGEGIKKIKSISEKEGRDPGKLTYSVRNRVNILVSGAGAGDLSVKKSNEPAFSMRGPGAEIADYIDEYRRLGVSHIAFDPDADDVGEIYDMMEILSKEILPAFKD